MSDLAEFDNAINLYAWAESLRLRSQLFVSLLLGFCLSLLCNLVVPVSCCGNEAKVASSAIKASMLGRKEQGIPTPGTRSLTEQRFRSAPLMRQFDAMVRCQNIDEELACRLDELMQHAQSQPADTPKLDQALAKYNSKSQKGKHGLKDVGVHYLGLPSGFDSSEEGAHLILNNTMDVRGLDAAQAIRQARLERMHQQFVCGLLELALGLGSVAPAESQCHIELGMQKIEQLAGRRQACKTLEMLGKWLTINDTDTTVIPSVNAGASSVQQKVELITQLTLKNDPLVIMLNNRLHAYSDHSKPMRRTAKVVEGTTTGLAMLGPGFGVPIAAHAANAAWGVANGGSEESKLLKEIYLQKRLDSRRSVVNNEAYLILLNYSQGAEHKNISQLICAEALLAQLVGAVGIPQIVDHPVVAHGTFVNRPIHADLSH